MIDTPEALSLVVVGAIFTVTASISAALRLRAKAITKARIVTEDYLCLASLFFVCAMLVCIVLRSCPRLHRHQPVVC